MLMLDDEFLFLFFFFFFGIYTGVHNDSIRIWGLEFGSVSFFGNFYFDSVSTHGG